MGTVTVPESRMKLAIRISGLLGSMGARGNTPASTAFRLVFGIFGDDFDHDSPTWIGFMSAFNCALGLSEIAISEAGRGDKVRAAQEVIEDATRRLRSFAWGKDKALRLPMSENEIDRMAEAVTRTSDAVYEQNLAILDVLKRADPRELPEETPSNVIPFAARAHRREPSLLEPEPVA